MIFNGKKIIELEKELASVKKSLNKLLETLEDKNFSKDWKKYQKWKKMKNKLPDIEEMLHLKELKYLIQDREYYLTLKKKVESEVIDFKTKYGDVPKAPDSHGGGIGMRGKTNPTAGLVTILNEIIRIESKINSILKKLKKKKSNKDLVGLLKLYAISTKWLQP